MQPKQFVGCNSLPAYSNYNSLYGRLDKLKKIRFIRYSRSLLFFDLNRASILRFQENTCGYLVKEEVLIGPWLTRKFSNLIVDASKNLDSQESFE